VKSSAWVKGKPRFCIWTVMIPHISQTANPQSRLGTEIHRLRLATRLPVDSQNALSSGRQSAMSTELVRFSASAGGGMVAMSFSLRGSGRFNS